MTDLTDLYHYIGSDLGSSPSGDYRPVTGSERGRQHILRRLLTNPGDMPFHLNYGAGLGKLVGKTVNIAEWTALIVGQMLLEDCVAQSPKPTVKLTQFSGGVSVYVTYTDAYSNQPQTLSFDVTN
jgi:hypothetical protein